MQPPVAHGIGQAATVCSVESGDYWKRICAPFLKGKKDKIGRSLTQADMAEAIEKESGKDTARALVGHWLKGIREPYISQFVALCRQLGVEPEEAIKGDLESEREKRRHQESVKITARQSDSTLIYNSKHGHRARSDKKKNRRTG